MCCNRRAYPGVSILDVQGVQALHESQRSKHLQLLSTVPQRSLAEDKGLFILPSATSPKHAIYNITDVL